MMILWRPQLGVVGDLRVVGMHLLAFPKCHIWRGLSVNFGASYQWAAYMINAHIYNTMSAFNCLPEEGGLNLAQCLSPCDRTPSLTTVWYIYMALHVTLTQSTSPTSDFSQKRSRSTSLAFFLFRSLLRWALCPRLPGFAGLGGLHSYLASLDLPSSGFAGFAIPGLTSGLDLLRPAHSSGGTVLQGGRV